jgi:hypothetical protein
MTAINKSKSKSTKSPAPATKPASPAAKKKAAPIPVGRDVTPVAPASPAPAPKPVTENASAKSADTTIIAKIDVGFGNALYLRGEGPGLNWAQGVVMTCLADDQWRITLGESARPITFKFMLNDVTWSTGPDYVASPGETITLTPQF